MQRAAMTRREGAELGQIMGAVAIGEEAGLPVDASLDEVDRHAAQAQPHASCHGATLRHRRHARDVPFGARGESVRLTPAGGGAGAQRGRVVWIGI